MNRVMTGETAHLAGDAAERSVARDYARRGYSLAATRWRGTGAEIDLILHRGDAVVFVEVKKSRDFARAAERLSLAQQRRIHASAGEYLATRPGGLLTECRFDVALVDGQGRTRVIENAFGQ